MLLKTAGSRDMHNFSDVCCALSPQSPYDDDANTSLRSADANSVLRSTGSHILSTRLNALQNLETQEHQKFSWAPAGVG